MEQFASYDPGSYSLYFDLKSWFQARNVTRTIEKRAPARVINTPGTVIRNNKTTGNFFGGVVHSSSLNPDPISDKNVIFNPGFRTWL